MSVRIIKASQKNPFRGACVQWTEDGRQRIKKFSFYNIKTRSLHSKDQINKIIQQAKDFDNLKKQQKALSDLEFELSRAGTIQNEDGILTAYVGVPNVSIKFIALPSGVSLGVRLTRLKKTVHIGNKSFDEINNLFRSYQSSYYESNKLDEIHALRYQLKISFYRRFLKQAYESLESASASQYVYKKDKLFHSRSPRTGYSFNAPGFTLSFLIKRNSNNNTNKYRISPTIFIRYLEDGKSKAGPSFLFSTYEKMLKKWPLAVEEYCRLRKTACNHSLESGYPTRKEWDQLMRAAEAELKRKISEEGWYNPDALKSVSSSKLTDS